MTEELAKKFELLKSIKTGNAPDRSKLFRKLFYLAGETSFYCQHLYTKRVGDKRETAIDIYMWSLQGTSIDITALLSTTQKYIKDVQISKVRNPKRFTRSKEFIKFVYTPEVSWALLNHDIKQKGNFYTKP